MKISRVNLLIVLLVAMIAVSSCSKNYYSGNGGRKSKNCGCPAVR
ncbi:hypothetical protein ACFS6H_02810 [Terrimonas rubra]|uniref:Lipoprotein n=1 Tax=Terrimonas rubra TaxID=1035890 RepID=A0ABW6A0T2_9BACT